MLIAAGLVLATAAWAFVFRLPREGLWRRTWIAAPLLVAYSLVALLAEDRLGSTVGPIDVVEVGVGLGVGAVWLVATQIGHRILCRLFPAFLAQVNDLYRIRDDTTPVWSMVGAVAVMGLAEELLFRGLVQGSIGLAAAVIAYTLVQAVEGKWALGLAALLGGLVWGLLFAWRDGLVAPVVAHVLWTATLTFVWPLRGCGAPDATAECEAATRGPAIPTPTMQETPMTRFENHNRSEADLPVDRQSIWEVLTDPSCLAALTPLIRDITADGDTWCWQLSGISALGVSVAPSFTEQMTFTPTERIEYQHAPPKGTQEKAGADGVYTLTELPDGRCRLFVDLTMWVDLPLPRLSRRAVERVMAESMQRAGDRFADNLYRHLDIDPADVEVRVPA